ncbi:ATP-binding cassette domain-containing protein [Conexibacter woesei]|uniref:branched-chain amino acid ABC transporter ATP-binding protein/permease n=1 Tax=Conexibacter woesei TaxID=191495 RepID=UPI0004146D5C|nr:ATP-binding cassette domain-containing protein [Conexibacter woesei]
MSAPTLRRAARTTGPLVAVVVLALVLVPAYVGQYWTFLLTSGLIAVVVMQSLGVITGRVGVISLCQLSFAMIGAWVVGWCNVKGVPGGFYVWTLLAGLAAVPAGLLIGGPALRLRGVNLAITTFAFATAVDVVFSAKQFPGTDSFSFVERPAAFTSDGGYFQFVLLVVGIIFIILQVVDRTRLGASWIELRYSERGAAAHGTSVASSKLAAFGVAAFIAGVSGALLVGQAGSTTPQAFGAQTSLFYFAIAVTIGVHNWDAAVIAGMAGALMPVLLEKLDLSQSYANIAFGVLGVAVLAQGRGQMGQSDIIKMRRQAKRAREATERAAAADAEAPLAVEALLDAPAAAAIRARRVVPHDAPPALELRDVTVRFGSVTAVDDASLVLPKGSVTALLGPNGAGKSTLINAATGFAPMTGQVLLEGKDINKLAPHKRARAGLRRSFQQLRVPPGLTAGMFLQTAAGRSMSAAEIAEFLEWFDCPSADVPIGTLDVGARRMLEVAGLAAGRPAVLLLDEPAAGQGAAETELLGRRIAEIPERTGSTVLLVEHDIDLVRAACDALVVMDFGRVIAAGLPDEVLADPAVVEAYVGSGPHAGAAA